MKPVPSCHPEGKANTKTVTAMGAGLCMALLFVACVPSAAGYEGIVLHVKPDTDPGGDGSKGRPFATVFEARDAIRAMKREGGLTGPVTVLLAGGRHEITEPLILGPEDSGTADTPVTWTTAPGEIAVLFGGRRITGWEAGADGRWTVELPEVRDGTWYFRQLLVDGESMPRTRLPKEGFYAIADWAVKNRPAWASPGDHFFYDEGDIDPDWSNLADVEVAILRVWVSSRQHIESVDPAAKRVDFLETTRYTYRDELTGNGARYFVENVAEEVDEPGEWYLDRPTGTLTYIPRAGEDPETTAIVAPVARYLVSIKGDVLAEGPVEHIAFEGISFTCSNWMLPEGSAGDGQSAPAVEGAVIMEGARHCAFDRCTFTDLNSYAIDIRSGCRDNRITHCVMDRLGGGGIRMTGGNTTSHPDLRTGWNVIADNRIHHIGQTYHAATGIFLQDSGSNRITHNEISHTYYSAITVGWVWGYRPSVSTHNEISFNHIHDVGQGMLSDMGGIYHLGVAPGTVIRNNLIHDVNSHGYGGWGIYTDEGSSHLLIENNIAYNTKFSPFDQHYGRWNIIRNNIFALGREDLFRRSQTEEHISFFVERNIFYWEGDTILLAGRWEDRTYMWRPGKPRQDLVEDHETHRFDWNLYWNPDKPREEVRFVDLTWDGWQEKGQDRHSVYADPGFADPHDGDFSMPADSPAYTLGFRPIDMSTVGPRE